MMKYCGENEFFPTGFSFDIFHHLLFFSEDFFRGLQNPISIWGNYTSLSLIINVADFVGFIFCYFHGFPVFLLIGMGR